jgi:hypothetical protein
VVGGGGAKLDRSLPLPASRQTRFRLHIDLQRVISASCLA